MIFTLLVYIWCSWRIFFLKKIKPWSFCPRIMNERHHITREHMQRRRIKSHSEMSFELGKA